MNTQLQQPKKHLNDVYVIRPIAIFLLVVYHSFIIYRGGWRQPVDFQYVELYDWIATLCSAFRLELLVFCSGYLFALTLTRKQQSFWKMASSKAKRLLLPSVVFSAIYVILFYNTKERTVGELLLAIVSGAGHMWYLPMLYWVMLMCYGVDKINYPNWLKIAGLAALPALSILPLPLQIDRATYYALFFYLGMLIYRNRDVIIAKIKTIKQVVLWLLIFVCVYAVGLYISEGGMMDTYMNSDNLIEKAIAVEIIKYVKIVYCILGIIFIYILVNYFLEVKKISVAPWVINLSGLCFGIYLFQQFILQILYYKTQLPSLVGPYWLPWVGLVITLILSYLLTKLSLKTKIGRQLM